MGMMIDFRVFLLLTFVIYIFGFLMGYITGRYNRMKEICERCCFFEVCTRLGRIENKNCIYGNTADKDKGESHEEKDSATMQ